MFVVNRGDILVIKQVSFEHGWFYHYRIHSPKAESLKGNGFSGLHDYLHEVFDNCPNDYFKTGPRGSHLKFKIPKLEIKEVTGHEVCGLTQQGLMVNNARFNSNHSKVQVFMLEYDDKTLAVEVPIWLNPDEIDNFKEIFKEDAPLTGHIDVLRIEDDKIWIWDYKPNAHRETYAATQVYFYALMLSKRTGIDLDKFRCGYFDDNFAYVFKPEKDVISKSKIL